MTARLKHPLYKINRVITVNIKLFKEIKLKSTGLVIYHSEEKIFDEAMSLKNFFFIKAIKVMR